MTAARRRTAFRKENERKISHECGLGAEAFATASTSESESIASSETESEYEAPKELEENQQNRFTYDKLAIVSDRYQVSSRGTAAIVNAALEDMGLLNDSNKLDRKKKVLREKLQVRIQNVN